MALLSKKVESIEKLIKKDNIIISGLLVNQSCSPLDAVAVFLKEKFGISNCISEVKVLGNSPPRLLVKFVKNAAKHFVLQNRRKLMGRFLLITTKLKLNVSASTTFDRLSRNCGARERT